MVAKNVPKIEYVPTICPYCGTGCGLNFVVKDGKIIGVEPWKRHPVNEGKVCPNKKGIKLKIRLSFRYYSLNHHGDFVRI